MMRLLAACLSMTSVASLAVPALDTIKGCETDQGSCPVVLLQTSLDVEDQEPTFEPESWVVPTKSPLLHEGEVVGYTTSPFDGDPVRCLEASCEYGVFLTEEMRRDGREKGHQTQVALYNFWGLDQSLKEGEVTVGMVKANHPVGDNTSYYKLNGSVLYDVIKNMLDEHGAPGQGGSVGSWLQVAGLRFQATWLPATEWVHTREGVVHQTVRVVAGVGDRPEGVERIPGTWTLRNVWVDVEDGRWAPLDHNYSYSVVSNQHVRFSMKNQLIASDAEPIDDVGDPISRLVIDVFRQRTTVSPPMNDDRQLLAESLEILGRNQEPIYIDGCRDHPCEYGTLACEEFRRVGRELGHNTHIAFYSGALFERRADMAPSSHAFPEEVAHAAGMPLATKQAEVAEDVTMDDMFQIHPGGQLLTFFWLSGVTIRQILQVMLADHGPPGEGTKASWLQTAGLRFQATWDAVRKEWVLGPVEADLGNGAWQLVDNDLDYSVVADASLLVDGGYDFVGKSAKMSVGAMDVEGFVGAGRGFDFVAQNAVMQRMPQEGWGPAVVAVMAGIFRTRSPVPPVLMDDSVCLRGNCSWLPGAQSRVMTPSDDRDMTDVTSRSGDGWKWRINAGYEAATGPKPKEAVQDVGENAVAMARDHLFWVIVCALGTLLCLCCCCCLHHLFGK